MTWLILSIISSSLIFVIFKWIPKFGAQTFHAIVVNYAVAFFIGIAIAGAQPGGIPEYSNAPWLFHGLLIGVLFISIFYLMAYTSQHIGVAISSLATKMSLVVPVILLVILHDSEDMTVVKFVGLALAITGVYLSTVGHGEVKIKRHLLLLPFAVFLGSGLIDYTLSVLSVMANDRDTYLLTSAPFLTSAFIGLIVLMFQRISKKETLKRKSLIAGVILGVVNYASVYFLLRAMQSSFLQKSSLIPINNLGVVLLSGLLALIIFKEHFSIKNRVGYLLAILSIVVIGWFG